MKYCRSEPFIPEISYRGTIAMGETPYSIIEKNIEKKYNKLIESYQMPYIDKSTKDILDKYCKKLGIFN